MGIDDAVPVPSKGMGKPDVLRLLRDRFPEFEHLFGDSDDLDPEVAEPHYSYGLLVNEVLNKKEDKALLLRISSFIDELILSKDAWLEELAVIEVLEGLAQDPALALELYSTIGPEAKDALKEVERQMYGRVRE
jgi:hypothetical protein